MYPLSETLIVKKIKAGYEHFNSLRNAEKFSNKVKSDEWYKHISDFNLQLTETAYNIRYINMTYQKKLVGKYSVTMTPDDFYVDNCYETYKAVCTSTVPISGARLRWKLYSGLLREKRLTAHQEDHEQWEIDALMMKEFTKHSSVDTRDDPICQEDIATCREVPFSDRRLCSIGTCPTMI